MIGPDISNAIQSAIVEGRLGEAKSLIQKGLDTPCHFELVRNERDSRRMHIIIWQIHSAGRAVIGLPDSAFTPNSTITRRLINTLPLLASYHASGAVECGQVILNLGDAGAVPGLAFSDWRPEYYLVPDEVYLGNGGYRSIRLHFERHAVPWDQRAEIALWRGGSSGQSEDGGWTGLPRVQLCRFAAEYPDLFDIGITHAATEAMTDTLKTEGLMRERVPAGDFNKYRYQVDIDGNSNAWASLFIKLLTGSPVLKVQSKKGFRQWYYDRLVPWHNYVPVSADLADLARKVRWLIGHDREAQEIGERGRQLALSMEYDREIVAAFPTITCAIREAEFTAGIHEPVRNAPATTAVAVDQLYAEDVALPPSITLQRVLTYHGTVLFADTAKGELRHGPISTSPHNVFLAVVGETGHLLHISPDGSRYSVRVFPQRKGHLAAPTPAIDPVAPMEFCILQAPRSTFGLASSELYLCAENHGRVTLSRSVRGPWETFGELQSGTSDDARIG